VPSEIFDTDVQKAIEKLHIVPGKSVEHAAFNDHKTLMQKLKAQATLNDRIKEFVTDPVAIQERINKVKEKRWDRKVDGVINTIKKEGTTFNALQNN